MCVSHSTRRSLFDWKSFHHNFSIFPIETFEFCALSHSQDEWKKKIFKKNQKKIKKKIVNFASSPYYIDCTTALLYYIAGEIFFFESIWPCWCMCSCFTTMSKVLSCVICGAAWKFFRWLNRVVTVSWRNQRCSIFKILNFNDTCLFLGKNSLGVMGCWCSPGVDAYYDPEQACRFRHPNSSTSPGSRDHYMFLKCPAWSHDYRVPAFCCGTQLDKKCCEWSTFVINSMGGGHTDVG